MRVLGHFTRSFISVESRNAGVRLDAAIEPAWRGLGTEATFDAANELES